MSLPSRTQVMAAVETLTAAGFRIVGPAVERMRLLSVADIQEVLGVGEGKAREILRAMPGAVMLPGGDLRVSAVEVEKWIEARALPKS